MKKLFFSTFFAVCAMAMFAGNNYSVNDAALDAAFSQAEEIVITDMNFDAIMIPAVAEPKIVSFGEGDKNAWIAWALTNSGYIGICGVHRLYLGTGMGTFIGYLLTVGGCGIVQTVDWVVLLIEAIQEKDITKYVNNPKFIMW